MMSIALERMDKEVVTKLRYHLEKLLHQEISFTTPSSREIGLDKEKECDKRVADALSYLHNDCFPPIVRRDISSKNGLLDLEYEARASDFGIAKFFKLDSSNRTELAGTYGYIALGTYFIRTC
ncbi:hypothetical protein CUMW_220580 [Citrus unshiu]|uniref:non-specific serine/threonine protein kinase n=1 Tax=Citrus unshiu TaxID=55188 RepID=A0A2H5QDS5_CITUN|nr:hypothetical protein CUMW_220580 [Citrus unshiu]